MKCICESAQYPQLAAGAAYYVGYPNLYCVGLPLGQSFYDSMVVEVTKRMGKGLSLDLSYALSRQTGDTFSNFGDSYDTALNGIQDPTNLKGAAHTLSPYDQPNVVKGFDTYQLPLGKGNRLLGSAGRVTNSLASGWVFSGLVTYASGAPLTFYSPNIYNYYPGWAAVYVHYKLGNYQGSQFKPGKFTAPTGADPAPGGDRYFPSSVVVNPPDGQLGTAPSRIGALRGFGLKNEDAGMSKSFNFRRDQKYTVSARVEFYNLFRRNTFAIPKTTVGGPQFGYVIGSSDSPRQGQFGGRFEW